MSIKRLGALGAAIAVVIVAGAALFGGCGDDDSDAQATETDGAFLTGMVPHHEMAIDMAEMAQSQADHPQIALLAENIVAAQTSEIEDIDRIHQRLFDQPVDQVSHGTLGLDEHMMGMDMNMDALETAKPFDRQFIDMMIAHHQGAIRMARIELADGSDQETTNLATNVITAQSHEIEQMNQWREKWYGAASPVGGVPSEDEELPPADSDEGSMEGMEH